MRTEVHVAKVFHVDVARLDGSVEFLCTGRHTAGEVTTRKAVNMLSSESLGAR